MSARAMQVALGVAALLALAACRHAPAPRPTPATVTGSTTEPPPLKDVIAGRFLVGAALNERQFGGRDRVGAALVVRHFTTISPENVLKWALVHPKPGRYDFGPSDRYVEFGRSHGMFVVGHTLVWHSQVPKWVFEDRAGRPVGRDTLLARMRDHIFTVVGRYRGRIGGWDVVNEALNEDGTLRDSPWRRIIGDDYIVQAFRFAHEADPAAELYYNDYSLETPAKRDGAVRLVRSLQAAGITVAAIGTQEHNHMDWPSVADVDSTITAFGALGVGVNVTELDIDVLPRVTRGATADVALHAERDRALDPYAAGLPDSVQRALARRYGELFAAYLRHPGVVRRVTFWGVRDGDSWLNGWPVKGRTSYPLLFDRAGRPKRAFVAVLDATVAAPPAALPRP